MKNLKLIAVILFGLIIFQNVNAQDKLFYKSGKEVNVYIQKETTNDIYFFKTKDDSVRYMISKSDLRQIIYSGGEIKVLSTNYSIAYDTTSSDTLKLNSFARKGIYNCWIYGNFEMSYKMRRGFIKSTEDTGIVFVVSKSKNTFVFRDTILKYQDVSNIEQIKIRRKGGVGKGILVGAGVGFLVGGFLGLINVPNYGVLESLPPGENALAGGTIFSIPGMIIGGIVGSARVKIPINRNRQQYEEHKKLIASYSIIKN